MCHDASNGQKGAEEKAFQDKVKNLHQKIMSEHVSLFKVEDLKVFVNIPGPSGYSKGDLGRLRNLEKLISLRKIRPQA